MPTTAEILEQAYIDRMTKHAANSARVDRLVRTHRANHAKALTKTSPHIQLARLGSPAPTTVTYEVLPSWNINKVVGATTSQPPNQSFLDVYHSLDINHKITVTQGSSQDIALQGFPTFVRVSTATPPFDLTTVPGYSLDIDASTINGHIDGDSLSSWNDLSGHCTLANSTSDVFYHTNILNGLPGVLFNGAGTAHGFSISGMATFLEAAGYAVFWVMKPTNPQNGSYANVLADHGAVGFWIHSGQLSWYTGGDHLTTLLSLGAAQVVAFTHDTSDHEAFFVNGVADSTFAASGGDSTANGVGSDSGAPGENYAGYLFRVIVYNQAVSSPNVTSIINALRTQWAI